MEETLTGQRPTDTLYIYTQSGYVQGTISPSAPFTAEVRTGSVLKKSASGTTSSTGEYSAALSYQSDDGTGAHQGDTFTVTDHSTGKTYTQTLSMIAVLDEYTGTVIGQARPGAAVTLNLSRVYYAAGVVAAAVVVADAAGNFRFEFDALHNPDMTTGRPPWRGYYLKMEGRDIAGQAAFRSVQTAAPAYNWTLNSGGGGYFWPGDTVTQEIWRGTTLRARTTATVNGDGVPRSYFSINLNEGDVFRTRYRDTSGIERTIDLQPYHFTATVDLESRTITGTAIPGAAVFSFLDNASGGEGHKTLAGPDGTYSLTYNVMEAGRMLTMYRVADEGFTGIGMYAITMYTPTIRVDDFTGAVTGFGSPGTNSATAALWRSGNAIETASGTTTRSGKYSLKLVNETLPGDRLVVKTGTQTLPALEFGETTLTAYRTSTSVTAPMQGTAPAGRTATVSSTTCTVTAAADAAGVWIAPTPCSFQPTDKIQVTQTGDAGSIIGRSMWVTSPSATLTSPAPLATVGSTVTLSASSFDHDDNRPPAAVHFVVDGKTVAVDTTAPYSASVTLLKGNHKVWVYAIDSLNRRDASGKIISGGTAARTFTVA